MGLGLRTVVSEARNTNEVTFAKCLPVAQLLVSLEEVFKPESSPGVSYLPVPACRESSSVSLL